VQSILQGLGLLVSPSIHREGTNAAISNVSGVRISAAAKNLASIRLNRPVIREERGNKSRQNVYKLLI
jgi:hypothetical protein